MVDIFQSMCIGTIALAANCGFAFIDPFAEGFLR